MSESWMLVLCSSVVLCMSLPTGSAQAQEFERSPSVGVLLGRPGGFGAEGQLHMTPRMSVLIRGLGLSLGVHRAGWLGVAIRLSDDEDVHAYAAPLVGLHQCSPVRFGGGVSGCSDDRKLRPSAAAVAGVQGALSEGGRLSLGVEGGAWFVQEPGILYSFAAILRYRFAL